MWDRRAVEPGTLTHSFPVGRISVLHAAEVVSMEDSAVSAVRKKKNSSLRMAIDLASRGESAAVVSAGNTGATYALVKFMIGTLPGLTGCRWRRTFRTRGAPRLCWMSAPTLIANRSTWWSLR